MFIIDYQEEKFIMQNTQKTNEINRFKLTNFEIKYSDGIFQNFVVQSLLVS